MVFDALVDVGAAVANGFIDAISLFSVPFDLINTMCVGASYGVWVLGADLVLIVFGALSAVLGLRLALSIASFIISFVPTMNPSMGK